jgi:hypothetical protein
VVPSAPRLVAAGVLGAAVAVGVASPAVPPAHATNGFFGWTGFSGQQVVPFPDEDKCYPTPGGSVALNYTAADGHLFSDGYCTSGQDGGGHIAAYTQQSVRFNSFKLHMSERASAAN